MHLGPSLGSTRTPEGGNYARLLHTFHILAGGCGLPHRLESAHALGLFPHVVLL